MDDCSNHKKDIAGITDMKGLARMIVNLHHESLAELFHHLPEEFRLASENDYAIKKNGLGYHQAKIAEYLKKIEPHAKRCWEISQQFMEPAIKPVTIYCKECLAAPVEEQGIICSLCEASRNK